MTSRSSTKVAAIITAILLPYNGIFGAEQLPKGISDDFFWMPNSERSAIFEKYDFESQYQVYIYGCQVIEPPALGLADELAKQGASIVKPLESKLNAASDDLTIRDIAYVFREMNDLRTYDVLHDEQLMDKLLLKASGMKNAAWRIIVEEDLDKIREQKATK